MQPNDETPTGRDDVEAISQIAEQRRETLRQDLARPVPDFILSTDQAEVVYTFDPAMLPISQMNLQAFVNRLHEKYNITYKPQQLPQHLFPLGNPESEGGHPQATTAARELLETELPQRALEFADGRILVGNDDAVPIQAIAINREAVYVVVLGNSKIAEVVAKEVMEELWASAGIAKRWDRIKSMLQMISYATATKVEFGMPLRDFLTPAFKCFVDDEFLAGEGYAARSMSRSARDGFAPPPQHSLSLDGR